MLTHAVAKFHLRSPDLALMRSKKTEVRGKEVEIFFLKIVTVFDTL